MASRAMTPRIGRAGILHDWVYVGSERSYTTRTIDRARVVSAFLARGKNSNACGNNNGCSYGPAFKAMTDFRFHN